MTAKKNDRFVTMSIDFTELAEFSGYVEAYSESLTTSAFKRQLAATTHAALAAEFDKYVALHAAANKANYHHVYETAINGDPYRHVGNNAYKLWKHVRKPAGGDGWMGTFMFLPAKNRVPTPKQRRNSTVGEDPIRNVSNKDWLKFLEKGGGKRRYTFTWKAPMLEYDIPRYITPKRGKYLFVASEDFHTPMKGADIGWRFVKSYMVSQEPPGDASGRFTWAWSMFWLIDDEDFKRAVGNSSERVINEGMRKGQYVTKAPRRVTQKMYAVSDYQQALKIGKARARKTAKMDLARLERMRDKSEWIMWGGGFNAE